MSNLERGGPPEIGSEQAMLDSILGPLVSVTLGATSGSECEDLPANFEALQIKYKGDDAYRTQVNKAIASLTKCKKSCSDYQAMINNYSDVFQCLHGVADYVVKIQGGKSGERLLDLLETVREYSKHIVVKNEPASPPRWNIRGDLSAAGPIELDTPSPAAIKVKRERL